MGLFYKLDIYKETVAMAQELKPCLKKMPKQIQYDIGDEILHLLRDMKYRIYLINTTVGEVKNQHFQTFIDMYNHLKILLDDCLQDGYLTLKGKYTIHQPLKRLDDIGKQVTKWQSYINKNMSHQIKTKNTNKIEISDEELDCIYKN